VARRSPTRSTTAKGRDGEQLAADHLAREGYRVLERNTRVGRAEIDIVAMDGDVLCFVEVRSRHAHSAALESVDARKQARVAKAASRFLAVHASETAADELPSCRFDVVVVDAAGAVQVVKNAFEAPVIFGEDEL
jgi:putative endonuclease